MAAAAQAAFGSPHPDPAKQLDFGVTGAATPATPAAMPAATSDGADEVGEVVWWFVCRSCWFVLNACGDGAMQS